MTIFSLRTRSGALTPLKCAGGRRSTVLAVVVSVILCLANPSWGQVEEEIMKRATSQLSDKFLEIRRDVLGVDTLAVSAVPSCYTRVCVRASKADYLSQC